MLYQKEIEFGNECRRNASTPLECGLCSRPRVAVPRVCQIHTRSTIVSLSTALNRTGIENLRENQPSSEIGVYLEELTAAKRHSATIKALG
jgi:hypothetical protein